MLKQDVRNSVIFFAAVILLLCGQSQAARKGTALAADTMQNVRINSDNTTLIQNEEMVVINPYNTDQVAAVWRDFRLGYRQVGHGYSTDGGATWTDQLFAAYETFPDFTWESDPGLGVDKHGNFIAFTLGLDQSATFSDIFVYRSTNGGQTWSTPTRVVNEMTGDFEDKEWMAIDRSNSANADNIYFAWTRFPQFGAPRIMFAKSEDTAQTWTSVQLSDGLSSVQWPTVTADDTGKIYVAWGRFSPPSIRMRTSLNGVSFTPEQTVVSTQSWFTTLNGGVGTFSFAALEADVSDSSPYQGTVYIAYMDRPLGDADIYFIKSTDRGASWSTPLRINDDSSSNGKDQFHPWISVNQDGIISVGFFDRRNDPGNLYYDLYLTQSFDGGNSWTPNLRITNASSFPETQLSASLRADFDPQKQPIAASPLGELLGEYIGVNSAGRYVNLVWTDTRRGNQDAFGSRFSGFYPPFLLAPPNGAVTEDQTPLFQWQQVGYYDTATTFKLQIAQDSNFSVVETTIAGLSTTSYQVDTLHLLSHGTHYWRVKGFTSGGDSSLYSRPFSLTIYACSGTELPGDVDANGSVALPDVIYLVNFVLDKSRLSPPCNGTDPNTCWPFTPLCRGDVNGSGGTPNLQDVIYLVNYVFDKSRLSPPCNGTDPGNCWTPIATGVCCFPSE